MKNKNFQNGGVGVLIIFGIVIMLLLIGGYYWVSLRSKNISPTTIQSSGHPQIKVTDYSQGVSQNQKTVILVEHSDSTFEKFIIPNATLNTFIKNLPTGDRVVSTTPRM